MRPVLLLLLETPAEEAALREHHAAPICNVAPHCSGICRASSAADAQRDCSSGVLAGTGVPSEHSLWAVVAGARARRSGPRADFQRCLQCRQR
jgi:hypothetical protein